MPRLELAELSPDVAPEVFLRDHYAPRRPAVLRGVPLDPAFTASLTPERAREITRGAEGAVDRNLFWWDVEEGFFGDAAPDPALLVELDRLVRPNRSAKPNRLWFSTLSTWTPWHYDGGSIDGFNLQVLGRKRFSLVDPDTPLPLCRLSGTSQRGFDDLTPAEREDLRWAEVELGPGDLLFLPRHWFHRVHTLEAWNVNVNWTWVDPAVPLGTATSRREVEVIAVRYRLARLLEALPEALTRGRRRHVVRYVREYGEGQDFAMAREFARRTSPWRLLRRVAAELGAPSQGALHRRLADEELRRNAGVRRAPDDFLAKGQAGS